jgi:hypothetical protein
VFTILTSRVHEDGQNVVELSLSYSLQSVDQFVLVLGSPLGPMTRFYPFLSLVTIVLMFLLGALSDERTGL